MLGGEVRYTVTRRGARPVSSAVTDLIAYEQAMDLHGRQNLEEFAARVRTNAADLVTTLTGLHAEGKRIAGFGAVVGAHGFIGRHLRRTLTDARPA